MTRAGTYWVYVVELDPEAMAERDRPDNGRLALYVGSTSQDPETRLRTHQTGKGKAARVFKRMKDPKRCKLRMDLSKMAGPYGTDDEAFAAEGDTHRLLESKGFLVFGDAGTPLFGKESG